MLFVSAAEGLSAKDVILKLLADWVKRK